MTSRRKTRLLIWLGWPVLVAVIPLVAPRILAAMEGWGLYWVWNWTPRAVTVALLIAVVPPAAAELAMNRHRDP